MDASDIVESVTPTLSRVLRAVICYPLVLIVLLLCWYHWRYRRILAFASKLPTTHPVWPIIGHAHILLRKGTRGMVMEGLNASKIAGSKGLPVYCVWIGPFPYVCVGSADDTYTVITSSKAKEKGPEYSLMNFVAKNMMLVAPGHIHKVTRRHINPMFTLRNLEQLFPVMNESSRRVVNDMSKHVGEGQVDILHSVGFAALRNISRVVFGPGFDFDSYELEFLDLQKVINGSVRLFSHRIVKFWLRCEWLFHFLWKKDIGDILGAWRRFVNGPLKNIQETRALDMKNELSPNGEKNTELSRPLDMADVYGGILTNYSEFTENDLATETLGLLLGGSDTIRATICSCLLSLAADNSVQERLYQEIVNVVGDGNEEVTNQNINDMPYLDQVMKETLRKFGIIPVITRVVTEDLELSTCTVPAGSTIAISLIGLHHNSTVYSDPLVFDPDRFSPENVSRQRYSFLPFGGGSRNCIGKIYATMFVKTVLVHIIRRYHLSTTVDPNSLRYQVTIAMISEDGYHMKVEPRNNNN